MSELQTLKSLLLERLGEVQRHNELLEKLRAEMADCADQAEQCRNRTMLARQRFNRLKALGDTSALDEAATIRKLEHDIRMAETRSEYILRYEIPEIESQRREHVDQLHERLRAAWNVARFVAIESASTPDERETIVRAEIHNIPGIAPYCDQLGLYQPQTGLIQKAVACVKQLTTSKE